jgi:hypothetical protein
MVKKLILFSSLLMLSFCVQAFADTSTDTVTPTITETVTTTITETVSPTSTETNETTLTVTQTITETASPVSTFTITETFTCTATPQGKVFAYPNPVYTNTLTIAYPIDGSRSVQTAQIKIYNLKGDNVAVITDDSPHGYTPFQIDKLARGTYFYRVTINYLGGSTVTTKYEKFSVIK